MKIKTIIFDCFGVIIDPIISNWYREKSLKHNFVDEKLKSVLEDFDMGILSEEDLADYFSKYKGVNLNTKEIQEEIDNYLRIDEALVEIIKKLKLKGFKIILLSNANNSFFERKIYPTYPEFKSLFDNIFISSVVKMVKPDHDIYLHALEKISSHPKEAIFIDDNKSNVDAAMSLGMHGFVYTGRDAFIKYLESLGIHL